VLGTLGSGLCRIESWEWHETGSKKANKTLNYLLKFGKRTLRSDFGHFGTIDSGLDYLWLELDLKSSFLMPYLVSSLCS
jgi:hypothetical protein